MTAVAALIGRRPLGLWNAFRSIPAAALDAGRAVVVHLVVFAVLAVPATAIYIAAEGTPEAVLAMPIAAVNVTVYALTLGHLGVLSYDGFGSAFGETSSDSDMFWLFSDDSPKVFFLLILFAVIATLAAGVTLRLRHGDTARATSHWVWTPVLFAVAGGVMTVMATMSFGAGAGAGFGGSLSVGPAAWFLLAFAVWGALAELVSRTIAPALAALVPAVWQRRAVGTRPEPVPAVPVVGSDDGPATPAQGTSAPLDRRTKRVLIGLGALVAVGVVAAIGISVANKVFYGPEKQAEAYFDALSDGDAGEALDLVRLDYPSEERALLTDDVLEASETNLSDVSFGDVEVSGEAATVTARFTIDGADQSQELTLEKTGSRFGVFDEWKIIDPGLGMVHVTAPGASSLEVNGESVRINGLEDGVTLPVFPGKYEITPSGGTSLLSYGSETITVGTDEESLDFEVEPTDELVSEVALQAKAFLDSCIKRDEAEPDGCPNRTYWSDLEDVSWKLTKAPTYTIESDYDGGWTFSTSSSGTAAVTATEPAIFDGDSPTKYTDEVQIDLSGSVRITGDSVTIEVDDSFF